LDLTGRVRSGIDADEQSRRALTALNGQILRQERSLMTQQVNRVSDKRRLAGAAEGDQLERALSLYERKGCTAMSARVRRQLVEAAAV
jgi:hypothetical protein